MLKLSTSGKIKAVYFSLGTTPSDDPNLDCAKAICDLFSQTKKTAKVAIYSLTDLNIVNAMIAAKERGVRVTVIVDKIQSKSQAMNYAVSKLTNAGITVYTASKQNFCMHNKVAIFDNYTVITGSYNWSKSASARNDENLIVLQGRNIAKLYEKYCFERVIQYETLSRV